MSESAANPHTSISRLIFYPALLTLAVTVVRTAGELLHGSSFFFNPEPGGAWALVGIVWLVPVFGIYFALRLWRQGDRPGSLARALGLTALGAVLFVAGFYLFQKVIQNLTGIFLMWSCAAVGGVLPILAWRKLFQVLAAYAYAARIPVAIVMLFATVKNWSSHYNANVPGFSPASGYFLFALVPQLVWWVSFTIIVGTLFGLVAACLAPGARRSSPAPA